MLLESSYIGAKKIGQNVLNAIFPVLVESLKGNYVVLGQGGETIKKGQRMQLILRGEKVIDSYTKESLGRSEEVIGEIEITGVTSKQSYGKVISSTKEDLESLFKPKMIRLALGFYLIAIGIIRLVDLNL